MINFLEELFYGNIEPLEEKTYITEKLRKKFKVLSDKEEQLRGRLTEENLKLFSEYTDRYNEYLSLSCLDSFITGFKIGGKMIYDTFID